MTLNRAPSQRWLVIWLQNPLTLDDDPVEPLPEPLKLRQQRDALLPVQGHLSGSEHGERPSQAFDRLGGQVFHAGLG